MIGTFVNVGTIIVGSLIGGLFKKIISERVNEALFTAMGLAAFGLGINAVVQNMPNSQYPVLFIFSLAFGGVIGTLLGYALGLSLGWLLKRYQFIKLPENVYTLDHLPISITLADVLIVGASAMLLCFLATLYPARQASRLQPAEALRYE